MRAWKVKQRVLRRRYLRESLRLARERDAEDNAEVALPDGEYVSWPCFWMVELYAPSHAAALKRGVRELQDGGGGIFPMWDLGEWVQGARAWTGGSHNLGLFAQEGLFMGHRQRVGVPREFAFMSAWLEQFAPGITVLVACFALEANRRGVIDDVLGSSYQSRVKPWKGHSGGHTVIGPEHRKEEEVKRVRVEYRGLAESWIAEHIPGLFSEDPGGHPAWDLLLTKKHAIADEERERGDRWASPLGLTRSPFSWWRDAELPGLTLMDSPMDPQRTKAVPTLTGVEDECLTILEGAHRGDTVDSLILELDDDLRSGFVQVAVLGAITAVETQFTRLRDRLAKAPRWWGTGRRLRKVRNEVMPRAFDLQTLEAATQSELALQQPLRSSSVVFRPVDPKLGERAFTRPDESLMELRQDAIKERGAAVASQGGEISLALRTQGELLLAMTNVRLQWLVLALTLVVGVLGIVGAVEK